MADYYKQGIMKNLDKLKENELIFIYTFMMKIFFLEDGNDET